MSLISLTLLACGSPDGSASRAPNAAAAQPLPVRVAVFNIWELGREKLEQVDAAGQGTERQLRGAAEILQLLRPDVVLINEIDFDFEERANARLFVERYLRVSQNGREPIDYPHIFFEPVNTGLVTGLDMNGDGRGDGPEDAYGFGHYPGQYGMALLSRYPIDREKARTFQHFPWRDQPGNLMPDGQNGKPEFYGPEQARLFRLSSKSHWDVPVQVGERVLHILAAHPTPGVFDGDEDRNGRRNFDEIRLWADYLSGGEKAAYLVDDVGRRGGLVEGESFVILGDLNADPTTDPSPYGISAIGQLLEHPRVVDPAPRSAGAVSLERFYEGAKEMRTSAWGRLDYALPSSDLEVVGSEVFWPPPGDPLHPLVAEEEASSDHRLVWVDLALEP